jgi:hypothetical protein
VNNKITLVGDSIENPANALTMIHASEMFGGGCRFRDTKGLAQANVTLPQASPVITTISEGELRTLHSRRIAFDNTPDATEVFGYEAGRDFAVMVGNERRGLSHTFSALATEHVQIPMASQRINCLNVAAASAVALYYLCGTRVGSMAVRNDPDRRRPELLFLAAHDHFEFGSAVRSAAAFGWKRALVEDRHNVWFNCDRGIRSEGRAAARRGRNDILLVPCGQNATHGFSHVTIITSRQEGIPIHRANLTRGANQLVVIPDEGQADFAAEKWTLLGAEVEFARLQIPATRFTYHYRLMATIAMAEVSRQIGAVRRSKFRKLRGRRFTTASLLNSRRLRENGPSGMT